MVDSGLIQDVLCSKTKDFNTFQKEANELSTTFVSIWKIILDAISHNLTFRLNISSFPLKSTFLQDASLALTSVT